MTIIQDFKLQYHTGGISQKIIFWNIGLFLLSLLINVLLIFINSDFDCKDLISLSSNPANLLWKPWSIITYAFFHAGFLHILSNMLMLNFAGRLFQTLFSEKQFIGLYFSSAIFAGLVYLICYISFPSLQMFSTTMVGASGAVMAILIAITTQSPLMQVRLFLFGNVKLWHIAAVLLVIDLAQLPLENTGGHLAHLGGAFFGFLFVKQLQNGRDIGILVTMIINFFTNFFSKKSNKPFKKIYRNNDSTATNVANRLSKNISQRQVDDILDKIGKSGYESLSTDEKQFLFKFGK
jgi:membrane associated rhomboid family serine protease